MPKLTIEQSHALPAPELRTRLNALTTQFAEQYEIEAKWSSDTHATFARKGASGSITCEAGRVVVIVDLAFVLWPLKGTIESRIRKELATVTGAP